MADYPPLSISIPIKGELLLRLDGSDELYSLGRIEYTTPNVVTIDAENVVYQRPERG